MNNHELLARAEDFVGKHLANESTGHDLHHVKRVYMMAMNLTAGMEVDTLTIGLASLLHDLDDYKISKGTTKARDFLKSNCPEKEDSVMSIIDNMSFSSHKEGKVVSSLEGMIVQDADRLDAIGAIGIARCFAYSGKVGRPIYDNSFDDYSGIAHFYQKLLGLAVLMNTDKAKQIASERTEFMKLYLERFFSEWKGE